MKLNLQKYLMFRYQRIQVSYRTQISLDVLNRVLNDALSFEEIIKQENIPFPSINEIIKKIKYKILIIQNDFYNFPRRDIYFVTKKKRRSKIEKN